MIAIVCLTSEELSLIGAHKVFGDESEDENDKEWVAPYEEGNAFAPFDEAKSTFTLSFRLFKYIKSFDSRKFICVKIFQMPNSRKFMHVKNIFSSNSRKFMSSISRFFNLAKLSARESLYA